MKGGLLFFFALLLQVVLFGQTLPIKVYSSEENSPVFVTGNMLQDPQGMMWFVEKKGITKYNGAKFQTIECAANSRFSDEIFHKIYLYQGKLHLLAEHHLYQIENDSVVVVQLLNAPPKGIKNVIVDAANNRYFMADGGLFHIVDNRWQPFLIDEKLIFDGAKNEYVFLDETTVATYSYQQALFLIDLQSKTFQKYDKPVLDVKKFKNSTYLLSRTGIEKLNLVKNEMQEKVLSMDEFVKLNIALAKIAVLEVDLEENLWVTSQFESLIKVSQDRTVTYYREQSGIPSLWISNLYADRENNIWITYYPGICKISAIKQYAYTSAEGLFSPSLIKIQKDEANQSFLVLSAKGTNRIRNNKLSKITDAKGNALISNCIHIRQNQLYSLEKDGLYRYKVEQDIVSQKKRLKALDFDQRSIILEKYDQLFVLRAGEFYRLVGDQLKLLLRFDQNVNHAVVDDWDNFWILLSSNYLQKVTYDFLNDSIKAVSGFDLRKVLKATNDVKGRSLFLDSNFDLWVVTSSRFLLRLHAPDTWTKVDVFKSNNKGVDIWNVCESNKVLYIVNNNGIHTLRLNDKKFEISDLNSVTNVYTSRDIAALSTSEICVEKFPGILLLQKSAEFKSAAHQVFINAVYINGIRYTNLKDKLHLTYLQNNITFEYSSNSYIDESTNRFQFQLSGEKPTEWSSAQKTNSVNFSALAPGDYTFKVRGFNALGRPSDNIASFSFKVEAVFWKTTWFVSLLFTFLLAVISVLYWYRFQQLKHIQVVRNSISRDLHDHLGSSVSSISMLSRIASVKSSRSEAIHGILEQIGKTATDAGENIDDIIWSINPKNDTLEATFIRIRNSVSELLESADITYVINLQNSSKKSFDTNLRRDIYMICKEAFANVVKYSQAEKATLDISVENNILSMIISDNGVGFELQRVLAGTRNGVKNIIQRVKSYKKATIQIDSVLGQGTIIKITLPVKYGTNM